MGKQRQRNVIRCPSEGLKALDIDADKIEDVIITPPALRPLRQPHLFPRARFHVQDKEMVYATGRCMCHPPLRHAFDVEDVVTMVRRLYDGRVAFHDGDDELAPGISVHFVGGHTMGLQMVRVWTQRGWVVLASDAAPLLRQHGAGTAVPDRLQRRRHAGRPQATRTRSPASRRHVIPGHDPLVLKRYPAPSRALEGIVARLDVDPVRD